MLGFVPLPNLLAGYFCAISETQQIGRRPNVRVGLCVSVVNITFLSLAELSASAVNLFLSALTFHLSPFSPIVRVCPRASAVNIFFNLFSACPVKFFVEKERSSFNRGGETIIFDGFHWDHINEQSVDT